MSDQNEEIRNKAADEFDRNAALYETVFIKIKPELNQKYVKLYEENMRFHDWKILAVNVITAQGRKRSKVNIVITDYQRAYVITYSGISKIDINYKEEDL